MNKGIGQPVRRVEDERFLRGAGAFTDDLRFTDAAHAIVVRSPHAHARLRDIDIQAARAAPGVLAVYTGENLAKAGIRPIPALTRTEPYALSNRDGSEMPDPPHWPLARGKVRHVGDPVAFVVAETVAAARAAAELVAVDYEPLAAAVEAEAALRPGAPRVWDDLPGNRSFEWAAGDHAAADAAFAGAARVVRVEVVNNRQIVAFMEPRAIVAQYDPTTDRYTVHAGSQSAHGIRDMLAHVLDLPADNLHVLTPDTGGGFGARAVLYPEFPIVAFAARRTGRPVKWTAERSEGFATDTQARDHAIRGELALDAEGRFLAIRVSSTWRHGAYLPSRGLWVIAAHMAPMICGVYDIPAASFVLRGVFTNTASVHAFRGVGRAEAAYLLERLVDAAARETGIDRLALRRRNVLPSEAMPHATPMGSVYDSGAFEHNLDLALDAAGWKGFEGRRAEAARRGRLRGIGVSLFVDSAGGAPTEFAEVEAGGDGTLTAYLGTQDFGMGHATVYAQVISDRLGIPFECVRLVEGDTARVRMGFGSHASRSMRAGGTAMVLGADKMIAAGKEAAGELLEAATADIEYSEGRYTVAGTDRSVGLFEVAAAVERAGCRLVDSAEYTTDGPAYPNGCQVAEVEIDPETGRLSLLGHTLVLDMGRALNPLLIHGQMHGGLAQGIGQAAQERVVYDPESGQLASGSFMDYALPRAGDLPSFNTAINEVPSADNPLGVKGCGEGPTTGSPAAVVNAALDALAPRGVSHLDMPLTPERLWRALQDARPLS